MSHETRHLVNSFECLPPYTLSYILDSLLLISPTNFSVSPTYSIPSYKYFRDELGVFFLLNNRQTGDFSSKIILYFYNLSPNKKKCFISKLADKKMLSENPFRHLKALSDQSWGRIAIFLSLNVKL